MADFQILKGIRSSIPLDKDGNPDPTKKVDVYVPGDEDDYEAIEKPTKAQLKSLEERGAIFVPEKKPSRRKAS